jgi:ComF family protein
MAKPLLLFSTYLKAFLHLWYPHICLQCGDDCIQDHQILCTHCEAALPFTHFATMQNNPIEKIFWGRVPIEHAFSVLFFTKESIVQQIIFELKYKQNKKAAYLLGRLIAMELMRDPKYKEINLVVPIPISKRKNRKRGFNQSQLICEVILQSGIKADLFRGLLKNKDTLTQTHKDRVERNEQNNVLFKLDNFNALKGKHLLIVDDVITTGATLEAACHTLMKAHPASISIASAAYTIH